jgi:tRNA-splicing ligase RtcB
MNGKDIIAMGFEQGPHILKMLEVANGMPNSSVADIKLALLPFAPSLKMKLQSDVPYHVNIRAENELEEGNINKVHETMRVLMKTPVVRAGAIMPDTMPAGGVGTIPVGGVVASEAIHPGMHSSDVCCSLMLTEFEDANPLDVLNSVQSATHFGPGGRRNGNRYTLSSRIYEQFQNNKFLSGSKILQAANEHLGTQGDGNHFSYVGVSKNTGKTCLVTHHGSRGPGAGLYKLGMQSAEKFRRKLSPDTLKVNAWIPFDTEDGEAYWAALQTMRLWTKANHNCIHQAVVDDLKVKFSDRYWNEHNFVFRKSDGLFYHAKGATPAFDGWAKDATEKTIIPLNMAEPILIVKGSNADNGLGFSPHGAGRNLSRTAHKRLHEGRTDAEIFAEETADIDARFFMGITDISELPSAYKNAESVRSQIAEFDLAEVVDEILPFGCIMAGDWQQNAPWKNKRKATK